MAKPTRINYGIKRKRCEANLISSGKRCSKDAVIQGLCLSHYHSEFLKWKKKKEQKNDK